MTTFKLAAIKILRKFNKPLHYNEITKHAIEQNLIETSGITPEATLNAQITVDIKRKKTKSAFIRVKPGIFKINSEYTIEKEKIEEEEAILDVAEKEIETKSTQYIGKAGEYLVISKLLFKEFNSTIMSVDDGIDIIATKNDKTYNIQVKTANEKFGKYVSNINIHSYQKYNSSNTYYIFVLRGKSINFLILPFVEVQKNIDQKNILVVSKGKQYRATIILKDEKIFLGKLSNDVTYYNNNWNLIK